MGIIADWLQNRADILEKQRREEIDLAMQKIAATPTGLALTEMAYHKKMFIRYDPDISRDARAVFVPSRFINLWTGVRGTDLAITLAHELRHADQDARNLTMHRKTNVRANMIIHRFEEADAYAVSAQVAWEMTALRIDEKAWTCFRSGQKNIAAAYRAAAEADPRAVADGRALKAAFDAFFTSPCGIRDDYDRHALKMSGEQLDRLKAGQRANTLQDRKRPDDPPLMSESHLREYGRMADGVNYLGEVRTTSAIYAAPPAAWNQRTLEKLEERAQTALAVPLAPRGGSSL